MYLGQTIYGLRTVMEPLLHLADKIETKPKTHHFDLNKSHKMACKAAKHMLANINGLRIQIGATTPTVTISTDAAGISDTKTGGIGIYIDESHYAAIPLSAARELFHDAPTQDRREIDFWEAYAVLVTLRIYSQRLSGARIRLRIDNPGASTAIRKLRHRTPRLHAVATAIMWTLGEIGARITEVELIPGRDNLLADALSRNLMDKFKTLMQESTEHR